MDIKKLFTTIAALLFSMLSMAQGCWPANYGGVMLQGFYWDSYSDTKWTKLEQQADELAQIFDLIWVPNSGNCGPGRGMGYMPIWWFDHNGTFGTEDELRSMINTFKSKNVGIIEDVVINHKAGVEDWCDFAEETWDGHTLTWSLADICSNDEAANNGYAPTGNLDTGDNFDGTRDLDHTSENVQQNVEWYLDFLLNDLGYAGFRYDMVKGYNGYYTGLYNATAKPKFSVGEFWDGYGNTSAWINKTAEYDYGNGKSAAFDFPLKFIINDVFGNGNWNGLADKGLIGVEDYRRWSVTFVDNHDTYRDANRLSSNVLAANALILGLPGTPCIFLTHWKHYKPQLKKMILARKAAGITNQSNTWDWENVNGGRVIETEGTKGKVLVICGYVVGNEYLDKHLEENYQLVVSGDAANPNFAFYMSKGLTLPDDLIETDVTGGGITIYVDTDPAQTNAHLYTWKGGDPLTTAWPGDKVSNFKTKIVNGKTWYYRTYDAIKLNAILNNGNGGDGNQTEDIMDLVGDQFFTYTGGGNYTNVTSEYIDYVYQDLPACATPQEGTYAYFENTGNWDNVYAYAFIKIDNDNSISVTGDWPGVIIEKVGQSDSGHDVYRWKATANASTPTTIIFNSGNNGKQTEDLEFVNATYYNADGPVETITQSEANARYAQLFNRDFTAGVRTTVCLPFSLNEEETESLSGRMYELSGYMNGYLHFSSVDQVEAFKPYIFIADETGKSFYKFAQKGLQEGEAQTATVGDFSFIGCDKDQTIISNDATICYDYNNQFVEVGKDEGVQIAPYRGFFTKNATSSATLKGALFDYEGVATSVEIVSNVAERPTIAIYTIDGRRVSTDLPSNLPKGIYIVNGKKVVR
ncbi:MAG: starch-binding protein [Prevotella sp.]|nr:starch-binding protein [Prevotella sp.]